jgi:hypothetical protein
VNPLIEYAALSYLNRKAVQQWKLLYSAGAFDSDTLIENLPQSLTSAAHALRRAQRLTAEIPRRVGLIFGIAMGILAGVALGIATKSFVAGGIFGLFVALFCGFLFYKVMRRFLCYVVLPVSGGEVNLWEESIRAVGFQASGREGEASIFKPTLKLGLASGSLFIERPNADLAYIVGPGASLVKVVMRRNL